MDFSSPPPPAGGHDGLPERPDARALFHSEAERKALAAARNAGCRVSFLRGEHLQRKLLLEAEAAAKRAVEAEA